MSNLIRRVVKRVQTGGLLGTIRYAREYLQMLLQTFLEERRRGITTARRVLPQELGATDWDAHYYVPTDYRTFHLAMRHLTIRPDQDVFVDFGSGKGRVLILAAAYPFRRVIGVEYSELLNTIARANLGAALSPLQSQKVELVQTDATLWPVPADASVFFFYDPFEGRILAEVCRNIQRSLAAAPRKITIIYVRPNESFAKQIRWQEWLTQRADIPCREGNIAIYESLPGTAAVAATAPALSPRTLTPPTGAGRGSTP